MDGNEYPFPDTSRSIRNRGEPFNTDPLEKQWSNYRREAVNIREEVDRMYRNILHTVDTESVAHSRMIPLEVNPETDPRVATMKVLCKPLPLSYHKYNTFGSGRKGMGDPVRKRDAPGPGQYHSPSGPSSLNTTNTSAVSIPKKGTSSFSMSPRRSALENPQIEKTSARVPGPGEYNLPSTFESHRPQSKNGSFGKAPRLSISDNDLPGPGTYATEAVKKHAVHASHTFRSTSPRLHVQKTCAPGPTHYRPEDADYFGKGKGVTIPKAPPVEKPLDVPGPGTYNIELSNKRDQSTKGVIPTAGRNNDGWGGKRLVEESPGPGSYEVQLDDGPSATMKFRYLDKTDETPGPGQYDVYCDNEGPKWSMRGKPIHKEEQPKPGPSDYDIVGNFSDAAPRIIFGTSPKNPPCNTNYPGPGSYDLLVPNESEAQKGSKFGTENRPPTSPISLIPGPGSYSVVVSSFGPSAILNNTSKRFSSSQNGVPGPGYYDAIVSSLTQHSAIVGSTLRESNFQHTTGTNSLVGPGTYEDKTTFNSGISISIGLPNTNATSPSLVGPGTYNTELHYPSPSAILGSSNRFVRAPADDTPGPGAYDVKVLLEDRAVIIGTSDREPFDKSNALLGPGTYDPRHPQEYLRSVVMSKDTRFKEPPNVGEVPGPGQYDPLHVGDDVPAPKFGSAPGHTFVEKSRAPGPGTYDVELDNAGLAFSFPTASRIVVEAPSDTPGPSQYFVAHPDAHQQTALVSGRPKDAKEDPNLGPGSYFVAVKSDPRSAVIGTTDRQTELHNNTDYPGPGTYFLDDRDPSKGAIITLSSRFPSEVSTTPGPGYYVVPPCNNSSAPTMAEKGYVKVPEVTPGPGSYNPRWVSMPEPSITIHAAPKVMGSPISVVPGPGTYNSPLEWATAMTIPKSLREDVQHSDTPGPGSYDLPQVLQQRAAVLGTMPRIPRDPMADVPGPGYYVYSPPVSSAQLLSFPQASREDQAVPDGFHPGPGQYSPYDPNLAAHSSFTMLPRRVVDPSNEVPGPGTYNSTIRQHAPSFSFGNVPHTTSQLPVTPGPGQYEHVILSPGQMTFMGTASKFPVLLKKDGPGPASYNPILYADVPSLSIGGTGHQELHHGSDTPGPGAYAVYQERVDHPISVPQSQRFPKDHTVSVPGPGEYQTHPSVTATAAIFGSSQRFTEKQAQDVPGPGAYCSPSTEVQNAFTIPRSVTCRSDMHKSDAPGPGSYSNPLVSIDPNTARSVLQASRFPKDAETVVPGPGQYELLERKIVGPIIGSSLRCFGPSQSLMEIPGPGTYDTIQDLKSTSGYSFGQRLDPKIHAPTPGPLDYTVGDGHLKVPPSAFFGKAQHRNPTELAARHANDVPGPNTYVLPGALQPLGTKIGTEQRPMAVEGFTFSPGPAQYDISHMGGMFDGPQYSIPQSEWRHRHANEGMAPGPGKYEGGRAKDLVLLRPPAHTIPMAVRAGLQPGEYTLVGPGAYEVGKTPYEGPSYSFPQGPNGNNVKDNGDPGPGYYFIEEPHKVQGPTIQGRWKDTSSNNNFPGPGEYRINDYDPYRRDKALILDFSKGGERILQPVVHTTNWPGPGEYNLGRPTCMTAGRSILRKFAPKFLEVSPGPPDYHPPSLQKPSYDPLAH